MQIMTEPTDIEKKNLEAHVELCAERYRYLEKKLANLETKLGSLAGSLGEIKNMMHAMMDRRNNQLISWGIGSIGTLIAVIGYLLAAHVFR
jgi:hypothetical protein